MYLKYFGNPYLSWKNLKNLYAYVRLALVTYRTRGFKDSKNAIGSNRTVTYRTRDFHES